MVPISPAGLPGGPTRELPAFEEHDILPALLGQMVGDTGTDDAATDNNGAGSIGQSQLRHLSIPPSTLNSFFLTALLLRQQARPCHSEQFHGSLDGRCIVNKSCSNRLPTKFLELDVESFGSLATGHGGKRDTPSRVKLGIG